ncbi:LexA family transcriptional regulator [Laribacter hongkongensis]|uniref:Repressor n=1 Tax=Laribacter hongkongensis TaxID=168471 RepID=A0A248LPL2_9NEIS|nr:S24 family peptidase [Laribacter hongkongensis]ASJ26246.1 repressor [Laribacter hongkongensis]MCG9024191.1 phage repressor protein C [Laribacter hongkongensis]MCG9026525.1 phage repressor protein C [Laribacter hongkongensis]MCG9040785.1 phage repressor protein C [Laribacter hongkongensis]MCG9060203.1 phage repressor protein C [Laribacter hongkongensis]
MNNTDNGSIPIHEERIGSRIARIVDLYDTKSAAAAAAGVSTLSLRRYISDEQTPSFLALAGLAKAKGVSLEWLATGVGAMFLADTMADEFRSGVPADVVDAGCPCTDTLGNPVNLQDFVFIPRYNLKASAGHGRDADGEKPIFSMAFRRYWIDNFLRIDPHDLSVISVKGDSMEGVLNDRDVILINHADNAPKDGLYVLRIDGDLVVKRLQRKPGGKIGIISANEAYAPYDIDLNDLPNDFAIVGRVVWFGRQL